jgi:hypothetical protein
MLSGDTDDRAEIGQLLNVIWSVLRRNVTLDYVDRAIPTKMPLTRRVIRVTN